MSPLSCEVTLSRRGKISTLLFCFWLSSQLVADLLPNRFLESSSAYEKVPITIPFSRERVICAGLKRRAGEDWIFGLAVPKIYRR